jgi:hypothetical protein
VNTELTESEEVMELTEALAGPESTEVLRDLDTALSAELKLTDSEEIQCLVAQRFTDSMEGKSLTA